MVSLPKVLLKSIIILRLKKLALIHSYTHIHTHLNYTNCASIDSRVGCLLETFIIRFMYSLMTDPAIVKNLPRKVRM